MTTKTALIVEDTAANLTFFEQLLLHAGFTIITAMTGKDALAQIKANDDLTLALIDMEMPDMSGLEVTLRLREKFTDTCVVVATMHDERTLMASAFDKGCDVFLVKPHGFMDLFKRLTTQGAAQVHQERPLIIDQYGARQFTTSVS
jgi:CheY-like chemotaxis protein